MLAAVTCTEDVSDLYASLSDKLERIVRVGVRAPDAVIEDACQAAWSRLLFHAANVQRDAVLSWLARTAVREAVRLVKRDAREMPLSRELLEVPADPAHGPHERFEARERLALVGTLPARQQRLLWLHGAGLSYAEMARHERCTTRTVERQLLRAKRSMRAAATQ